MNAFETLHSALSKEGVSSTPTLAAFVPLQSYCPSLEDLVHQLGDVFSSERLLGKRAVVFVDGVRKQVRANANSADECLESCLAAAGVTSEFVNVSTLVGAKGELHASLEHLPKLQERLAQTTDAVFVVLGSGTITDLVKHALHLNKSEAPLVVLPTALTVTAFTSAFAVIDEGGAKRTRPSKALDATLWVEPIICAAPIAMSRAGYGDLLARFVAYADWYLGYTIGLADRYDELANRLMEYFSDSIQNAASGFTENGLSGGATRDLSAALSMAGIAMSVSGETTPLSGFEHTISHALDFLRLTSQRELVFHGEQVGLATLTSAVCWDAFIEMAAPDAMSEPESPEKMKRLIRRLVNSAPFFAGDETLEKARSSEPEFKEQCNRAIELFSVDYLKKYEKWMASKDKFEKALRNWRDVQIKVRSLTLPAATIEQLLMQASLPTEPEQTKPPTSALEYRWAVRFSPFVRTRFCLSDLLFWLGLDPAAIAAL